MLEHNPHVHKIHVLDKPLLEKCRELNKEKFTQIIDLHHNLRTLVVKLVLGVPSYSFHKLNLEKWLIVNMKWNILPKKHIVERYLDTCAPSHIRNDHKGLEYFLPDELKNDSLLKSYINGYNGGETFTVFAIGGQHFTKKLPVEKMIEICKQVQHKIILIGGNEDLESASAVAADSENRVINLCGKLSVHESAALIRDAANVITHDTGMMHIAAAFNKPIISVWGNTIPEFGMTPYLIQHSSLAEVKGLSCRPCTKIGFDHCPKGHFKCMNDQNSEKIAAFANSNH